MMAYAWIVDVDHIAIADGNPDGLFAGQVESRVAWAGPHHAPHELVRQLRTGEGEHWRTKDADGELVYSGRWLSDGLGRSADEGFGPLDDLAGPDAGATTIEYLVDGKWEAL